MGKKILLVIVVFLFMALLLRGCFKVDKPSDDIEIKVKSDKQTFGYEVGKAQSVTKGGRDYILSRSEVGKYGGELITSTIGEGPKTFNPFNAKDSTSSEMGELMFDSLVVTDAYSGDVVGKLAKDFEILPDKKTYIFHLRKGLKWSDGKEITADDVVYTYNTIIFGGFGNTSARDAMLIEGVAPSVEKIDKYTVKFTTPKPFAPFLRQLSVPIAPKHVFKGATDKGKKFFDGFYGVTTKPQDFVTSGAFRLSEYVPAQRVVFVRNPDYYVIDKAGNKLPYLDKYIVLIVGDLNNELLKFEGKELDTVGIRGSNVSRFKEMERVSDYTVYNLGPDSGTMFLAFNLNTRKDENGKFYVPIKKQLWFNDLNFRRAVDYAIDRESMVFNILSGVGKPLYTAESLSSLFLNENLAKGHKRDLEKAKELLRQSGFYLDKEGFLRDKYHNRVEFNLFTNAGQTEREATGVMVKEDLAELGIKVNFKPIEFNSLVNKMVETLDFDTVIIGLTGSPLEVHSGYNVFTSRGSLHLFNQRKANDTKDDRLLWEKELDEIFNSGALELNPKARKAIYDRYQEIMYEQVPIIYLYSGLRISAIRNRFGNIHPTVLGGILHNLEEIYVK